MTDRKYLVIGLVVIITLGLGCVDNTSPKSSTDQEKSSAIAVQITDIPVQTTEIPVQTTTRIIENTPLPTPENKVLIEHYEKSVDKLTEYILSDGPEYKYPNPGMTFLIINLKITNQGYPSIKINKYSWYLKVSTKGNPGAYTETDKIFSGEKDGIECKETELENGGWMLCKIAFEVPKDYDKYKITWSGSNNKHIDWKYTPN